MRFANLAGARVLLDGERALDVAACSQGRFSSDPAALFDAWADLTAWARTVEAGQGLPYDPRELGPPVPMPRQVFAVALNYRPHAAEAGFEPPTSPLIFTKFPGCITGPSGVIALPPGHVDWELELVVVIAREAYRIPALHAWDIVAGLTIGQDLSERLLQLTGTPAQFSMGKSFPGFGPIGPALVTLDEVADPDDLELTCILSGERVQHARTSEMIFSVSQQIEHITSVCPVFPGDLIFTGTPAGVGNRREPRRFIGPADELISCIGGLGHMLHRFAPADPVESGGAGS